MLAVLALAFGLSAVPTQTSAAPFPSRPAGPPPTAGAGVSTAVVRVDAVVTDSRGRPITDLGPADFLILEDGAPRPIESVAFVRVGAAGATGAAAGISASDAAPRSTLESRADERAEAARDGTRLFALYLDEYHVADGPGVAAVRERLKDFIDRLAPRDLAVVVRPLDSLLALRVSSDRAALAAAVDAFEGRKGDYAPRSDFERRMLSGSPERVDAGRAQIAASALNALAAHLESLGPGRKTLIVVSEGFAPAPLRRDDALPTIDRVVRVASQGGVSIYVIDPRAFAPAGQTAAPGDEAVLRRLAADTGGAVMTTRADVDAGMPRMLADASGYYVVAFRPAHPDDGGRFHAIAVGVTRDAATVRVRRGYWSRAPVTERLARLAIEPVIPPLAKGPPLHTSPLIRPWFGVARAADGKLRVSFVWEPAPAIPGSRIKVEAPARVELKAAHLDGTDIFAGDVPPASPERDDASAEAAFDTAPGRLRVQLSIRGVDAKLLDTDVRDVVVGALAGPVEVGTAEVFRARTARQFREISADLAAAPVASREFSRAERLLIRIPCYGPADGLSVTATLAVQPASALGNPGPVMRDLPAVRVPDTPFYQIDLPLGALPAGAYRVSILAAGATGRADEAVLFRVTP